MLEDDGIDAAPGLAVDELLARRVGQGDSPPTLRLYTYRPHCVLVGRFQDLAHEVDVASCARQGYAINRRPTGGGAILMGPDQLGVALALRGRGTGLHGRPRQLMQRFSQGFVRGLSMLGINAGFRGKNDIEVRGRKIAGLGVCRDPSGGLLLHGSLLVDLDVALMAELLRLPDFEGGSLDEVATRTVTVRECLQRRAGMDEVRARIAAGFASAFEIVLEAGELDSDERRQALALARQKYATPDWLDQQTAVADRSGSASVRTAAGTVRARVQLAGRTVKAVHVRGDFFEDAGVIADLEGRLRWHSTAAGAVEATVAEWARGRSGETVPSASFARAIEAAIGQALSDVSGAAPPRPYGCFVSPGGAGG